MTNQKAMGRATTLLIEHGLAATHWGRRIVEAEKRGEFTTSDYKDAADWVTCACGRSAAGFSRVEGGDAPQDDHLHRLGDDFNNCVIEQNMLGAAITLGSIENRATALIDNPDLEETALIDHRKQTT